MEEAERLCDRVAIVDHGRIIALGTPRELIARMGGEHVVEFSLQTTGCDGTVGGCVQRTAGGHGCDTKMA